MKKDKEKEPEKTDKILSSTAPKKKGLEEERKDSDDSSDDEQVRVWNGGYGKSVLPTSPPVSA